MSLETYRAMRDFSATSEPKGRRGRSAGDSFVIQKHAARRLHYDLRLEMDGVLRSWAVTRGPSLVAGETRLAVHVEDHPLDYGDFEGTIPKGAYGAGEVILWDRGRWSPVADARAGYAKGHLEFVLAGEKLHGRWHLVRMQRKAGEKRDNWLLIKADDSAACPADAPDILEERPESVKSGRVIGEVAASSDAGSRTAEAAAKPKRVPARIPKKRAAGKAASKKTSPARKWRAPFPDFVPPALATLVAKPPASAGWLHEIKFDGYRLQARLKGGQVRLLTRSGLDWTDRFGAEVPAALAALPVEAAVIDGELVVEGSAGASDFSALQADLSEGRHDRFVFYAFDLLHLDGRDIARLPLVERKALLEPLIGDAPLRFSEHFTEDGALVLTHACRLSLEGVISKRGDAPYKSGRGRSWVKSKCSARQEFVVAGYTVSAGSDGAVGSLLLGVYEGDRLVSVGRVGTGFTARIARDLMARLAPIGRPESPFDEPLDAVQARDARFVAPELVAEVEFRAWTAGGNLRHAAFRGLREDKPAREIRRETPLGGAEAEGSSEEGGASSEKRAKGGSTPSVPREAGRSSAPVQRRTVRLTSPERVYWPGEGVTKAELADYYAAVWRQIAPHVVGRPLALLRAPEGIGRAQFFQKHGWRGMNAQIRKVQDPKAPGNPMLAIDDLDGLIALVQSAALEIHPWGSTLADWERPDRIVMDLDPGEGVDWAAVCGAAAEVRARLEEAGFAAFLKSSGGKGLHVVTPLVPRADWAAAKAFAKGIAAAMAADSPDAYVATVAKTKRKGRILVDWLRNQRGATAVAAFSARARPGATVSAPLFWDELGPKLDPAAFTVRTMPERLATLEDDPWEDFGRQARPLPGRQTRR